MILARVALSQVKLDAQLLDEFRVSANMTEKMFELYLNWYPAVAGYRILFDGLVVTLALCLEQVVGSVQV